MKRKDKDQQTLLEQILNEEMIPMEEQLTVFQLCDNVEELEKLKKEENNDRL